MSANSETAQNIVLEVSENIKGGYLLSAAPGNSTDRALVMAQVHATLALVEATEKVAEQARVANLIALDRAYFPGHQVHDGAYSRTTAGRWAPGVAEALRLT